MIKYTNISIFFLLIPFILSGGTPFLTETSTIPSNSSVEAVSNSHDKSPTNEIKTPREPNIEAQIREWIEELEEYESSIVKDKDNYKRVDINGYYSYSCLQFQLYTFKEYYEKWMEEILEEEEIEITEERARELIANCERQKELAFWMIKENPKNYIHWGYSVERGLGLPPTSL